MKKLFFRFQVFPYSILFEKEEEEVMKVIKTLLTIVEILAAKKRIDSKMNGF